ncbi:MAG: hypothetical protein OEV95_15110, partial [Gemmatimonadota bacterium]|nr:hypothetical protein [Gemmatimonadota bacterium]
MSVLSLIKRALPALALLPCALAAQTVEPSALNAISWRELGPARGGRSVAVAGSATRPLEYWMGTTGGG